MDCCKCIALMMTNDGDIWDYSLSVNGGKKQPAHNAAPIVAITTSAGTGSEVDMASVITNEKPQEKTGIFFTSMFPTLSIVDSNLMMSVPPKFTAYQGMDAFYHASESVINKNEHPMGEMFALKAIVSSSQDTCPLPIGMARTKKRVPTSHWQIPLPATTCSAHPSTRWSMSWAVIVTISCTAPD